jgi:uncharacterized protein (TIGR00725 family)
MGSGVEPYPELAAPLGAWIARAGCHLLTGGGRGVMEAAARAFCAVPGRRGLSIGIVRCDAAPSPDPASGRWRHRPRQNDWLELPIQTHLHTSDTSIHSRNHLNVLTADALVVLPGNAGTASEIVLAARYGRRAVLFLGARGTVAGRTAAELTADPALAAWLVAAGDLDEAAAAVGEILAAHGFAPPPRPEPATAASAAVAGPARARTPSRA